MPEAEANNPERKTPMTVVELPAQKWLRINGEEAKWFMSATSKAEPERMQLRAGKENPKVAMPTTGSSLRERNRATPLADGETPGRASDRMGTGKPRQPRSSTDSTRPTRAEDRIEVGRPICVLSASSEKGPQRFAPRANDADPGQAELCNGAGLPDIARLDTKITGSGHPELCANAEGPGCAASATGRKNTKPSRDKPKAGRGAPQRPGSRGGGATPAWVKSIAEAVSPIRANDWGKGDGPVCMLLSGEAMGPERAKLRVKIGDPQMTLSGAGAGRPGRERPATLTDSPKRAKLRMGVKEPV